MQMPAIHNPLNKLPLKVRPTGPQFLSYVVAILTVICSTSGLLFHETLYPTAELKQTFVANDVVNLIFGLPILLGSIWLAKNGRLTGLLVWPGALMYGLYNYIAYIIGRPFDWLTMIYLTIVVLSGFVIFDLLTSIDSETVKTHLTGAVPRKASGWVLFVFGILFSFLAINLTSGAVLAGESIPMTDLGVAIADMILSIFLVGGGLLLLMDKPLGFTGGLGLLLGSSMLFVGLIIFFFVRPVVTSEPFDLAELLTVSGMGLVCFVPFGLFLRGVWSRELK